MLTAKSGNPVTVTQGQEQRVFDAWGCKDVQIIPNGEKFALKMRFQLQSGDGRICPGHDKIFYCSDVLEDATLGPLAAAFFQAVIQKAFIGGVLS